jgi:hypothetical protein
MPFPLKLKPVRLVSHKLLFKILCILVRPFKAISLEFSALVGAINSEETMEVLKGFVINENCSVLFGSSYTALVLLQWLSSGLRVHKLRMCFVKKRKN